MKALIASVFRARRVSGAAFVCVLSLLALGLSAAPGQTQTFTISRNNAVQSEGNGGTKTFSFNVTLTGAVAGQTYNVTADTQNGPADAGSAPFPVGYVASATGDPGFGTAPGSGWDFVQKTQTFSFSSNSTQQFTVAVNGDSSDEYDERFTVRLAGATNGSGIFVNSATGIINNDDNPAVLSVNSIANNTTNQGAADSFTIEGTSGTTTNMTFRVAPKLPQWQGYSIPILHARRQC